MKLLWINFYLAYRNFIRQKHRSTFPIITISTGVAALILANGFINWILLDFRESTIKSQLGHLQIVYPKYHELGKSDPYNFLLPNIIPIELKIAKDLQQIKSITPRISFNGLISFNELTLSFIGDGISLEELTTFGDFPPITAGTNLSIDDPFGIIIGEGLARNLGVNIGDQVILVANTVSQGINAIEVTIRGLFSTVTKSYDDVALRLPIETTRKLLRTEGSHLWVILLNDTTQTDLVLTNLLKIPTLEKFEILPWYRLADFYNKTVNLFTRQMQGIWIIIALIILLSIFNSMTRNVRERVSEIGTAMALGIKRKNIMSQFLFEGLILGCIGSFIGIILGLFLAKIISSIGISMPPPPGTTHGYTAEIYVTKNIVFESILLAIGTALVASIYPAWKASHMLIVDALRHNR
jgi:putative ABC transport system permease protein